MAAAAVAVADVASAVENVAVCGTATRVANTLLAITRTLVQLCTYIHMHSHGSY